jgi:hypothetical protein
MGKLSGISIRWMTLYQADIGSTMPDENYQTKYCFRQLEFARRVEIRGSFFPHVPFVSGET